MNVNWERILNNTVVMIGLVAICFIMSQCLSSSSEMQLKKDILDAINQHSKCNCNSTYYGKAL